MILQNLFCKYICKSLQQKRVSAQSLTTLTWCQPGCWLCWHEVGMVNDYTNTESAWSLITMTLCQRTILLCRHCVRVVVDYLNTWQGSQWLSWHMVNYFTSEEEKANDRSNKKLNLIFSKILCPCCHWLHKLDVAVVIDYAETILSYRLSLTTQILSEELWRLLIRAGHASSK